MIPYLFANIEAPLRRSAHWAGVGIFLGGNGLAEDDWAAIVAVEALHDACGQGEIDVGHEQLFAL